MFFELDCYLRPLFISFFDELIYKSESSTGQKWHIYK